MVLWRNTDKLGDGPELRRRVTDAGKELSLLFHRLMAPGRLSLQVGRQRAAADGSVPARATR